MKLENGFYIMCGMPGVGKSTFINQIDKSEGVFIISPDAIRGIINGDEASQENPEAVWHEVHEQIRMYAPISHSHVVVLDATMARPRDRKRMTEFLRKYGVTYPILVFINKPLSIAKIQNSRRDRKVPEDVLERMSENLKQNPPSLDEGFGAIIEVR